MIGVLRQKANHVLLALVIIQIAGILYYAVFFRSHGYLPAPFLYDKSDTFMDFFNVLYWSNDPGRYSIWGSVYPPLNFLIIKALGWPFVGDLKFSDGLQLRDDARSLDLLIVAGWVLVPALVFSSKLFAGYSRLHRCFFAVIYVLSAPILFGMERGNLIVVCLPFVAGVMSSKGARRLLCIAILINLKPYFALFLLAPIMRGRWQDALFVMMAAGAIFVFTGLMFDPNFLYFLPNILNFGQSDAVFSGREVLALPSSIAAFAYALMMAVREGALLGRSGIDLDAVSTLISWVNAAVLFFAIVALFVGRNRLSQTQHLAILVVLTCNLGVWVGGYSLIFYPLIVPALLSFRLRWLYLGIVVVFLLPLDAIVLFRDALPSRLAYLSGTIVPVEYQLGLGTLVRPVLDLLLLILLSLEVLAKASLPVWRLKNEKRALLPEGSPAE